MHLAGLVTFGVSLNGRDVSETSLQFLYSAAPLLSQLWPSIGPVRGGTVVRMTSSSFIGRGFYWVSFQDSTSPAHIIHTQANHGATIDVTTPALFRWRCAIFESQEMDSSSPRFPVSAFHVYQQPQIDHISPACGPLQGNTSVVLHGQHMSGGSHHLCSFGSALVNASVDNAEVLRCTSPPVTASGAVALRASFNGQQFIDDLTQWTFTESPRISSLRPTAGAVAGGTLITLSGTGFDSGCDVLCNFASLQTVAATRLPTRQIVCATRSRCAS